MEKTPINHIKPLTAKALRDRRIGEGACCANCIFAYPLSIDLKTTLTECRQGPPALTYTPTTQNGHQIFVGAGSLTPRIISAPAEYFCGAWQRDPASVS